VTLSPLTASSVAGASNLAARISWFTGLATQYPPQAATMHPHRRLEQVDI